MTGQQPTARHSSQIPRGKALSGPHKSHFRQLVGAAKFRAQVATLGRLLAWRSQKIRRSSNELLRNVPVAKLNSTGTCQIVSVCGPAEVEMAMWSTWSFARFLPGLDITVILDGPIAAETEKLWHSIIQGIKIVQRQDADREAERCLAAYPRILEWRSHNRTGRKLADPHLWGHTPKVLIVDSDVLCLQYPAELADCIVNPDVVYTWNSDVSYSYVAPQSILMEILGAPLPHRVNSGLMIHPRSSGDTFSYVDGLLDKIKHDGRIRYSDRWFEQTLAAACVAFVAPHSASLPQAYSVVAGKTKRTQIVRHFVGSPLIRPRFFSEGIPHLLASL